MSRTRYRPRMMSSGSHFSILMKQDFKCKYCHHPISLRATKTVRRSTIDHVIPLSKGGTEFNNLVAACFQCNLLKADGTVDELMEKLKGHPQ